MSIGDARLDARTRAIVQAIASSPADSFPQQEPTIAGREALYRFFSNPRVTIEGLLRGHAHATVERIAQHNVVRLVHDTSPFRFAGDREGLGILRGAQRGFYGHVTLALAADDTREPLGVLAASAFIHADAEKNRGLTMRERKDICRAKKRDGGGPAGGSGKHSQRRLSSPRRRAQFT